MCYVQEYKEYHTDTEVHFQLFFTAAKLQEMLSGTGPHQKLKLVGKASIGMAADFAVSLFQPDHCLTSSNCPSDITLDAAYHVVLLTVSNCSSGVFWKRQ